MRRIVGLGLCAALAACTSLGTADRDVAPPSAEETLYVLGVSPETSRVRVSSGEVAYGLFEPDAWAVLARVYANPTGGYLVWKGPASQTDAVTLAHSQSCSGTTRMVPVYVPQRSTPK